MRLQHFALCMDSLLLPDGFITDMTDTSWKLVGRVTHSLTAD